MLPTAAEFRNKIDHSQAAYHFCVGQIPNTFPVEIIKKNDYYVPYLVTFQKQSHADSVLVELGWSFYCRYEAILERYIKDRDIKLTKTHSIKDWLEEHNIKIPKHYEEGLAVYRQIRNILHHDDGKSPNNDNTEIHLLCEQMQNFYELFIWIAESIEKSQKTPTKQSDSSIIK